MNYYELNDAIVNISKKYYPGIDYINMNKPQVIDINGIYNDVARTLPSAIMNLLFLGVTLLIIYYYIFPIWVKYFEEWSEYGELILKAGLIFNIIALLYICYFTFPNATFYIMVVSYILITYILYKGSIWLMKRKVRK